MTVTGWGCKIGSQVVRFDDLPIAAWVRIGKKSGEQWADVYRAPLKDLTAAVLIVEECVKVAEPDADPTARAEVLAPNVKKLDELIVAVEDDMPYEYRDGIPKEEAGPETAT